MHGKGVTPEIAAREAQILDGGPRIALMEMEDLPAESESVRDFLRQMAVVRDPDADYSDQVPTILPLMMRHPALFQLQASLGVQLLVHGDLPARMREIVILRVA
ncbi:MAG: hypothetical protein ABW169_11905, partial [Sphingobium sp.]